MKCFWCLKEHIIHTGENDTIHSHCRCHFRVHTVRKSNIESKSFHGQSRGNGHCRKEVDMICQIRIELYSPTCSATRKHMPKATRLSTSDFSCRVTEARLCLMYYNSSSAVRSPNTCLLGRNYQTCVLGN